MIWPLLFGAPAVRAQLDIDPNFNPNKILEDSEILNYNTMGLADIQTFLQNKGSFLSNYTTANTNGDLKTAAAIIYDATHNNYDCDSVTLSDQPTEAEKKLKCQAITTVNPKLILMLMQKEASLIEDGAPPQNHLDWATGYGCPDSWVCNPYYKGFGKQINSAALQFLAYMNEPDNYPFHVGQTYIAKDKYSILKSPGRAITDGDYNSIMNSPDLVTVVPQNLATAALYSYTPHIFNGNYNAYKIWNRYFPTIDRLYPDGSIIQADGDPRVWLINGGQKRHFASWSAFVSRFRREQIVTVAAAELDKYPTGDEIKFANYSLVQTPDKKIYLLVDQEKRPFASAAVFKKIGFNPAELESAAAEDLAAYRLGKTITATSTYVTGVLMQDKKTNDIYYVESGVRALVDKILLPLKFVGQKIIKKTTKQLAAYATTTPVLLDEGTLVRTDNFPAVYLISGGKKRPFADDTVFAKLNYNPMSVITVSSQFLYNYDMGEAIK
jgi:hypothetical protein